MTTVTCANCGSDIFQWATMPDGRPVWRHDDVDHMAGCRAATFSNDTGWNEDIPRSWLARPLRPGKTPKPTPKPDVLAERRVAATEMPPLTAATSRLATLIGMAVRNEMEQLHGGDIPDSLTDEPMAKINPIIRNAAATVLHEMEHPNNPRLNAYLALQEMLVPSYWEPPELVESVTTTA